MTTSLPLLGELPSGWRVVALEEVLSGGTRNGIYKPKEHHGTGTKIVNMGELFANPRLYGVPMRRLQLTESERSRFALEVGDLLFARRSLVNEGAGKCSIVMGLGEETVFESSIIRARPDREEVDSLFLYYLFTSPFGQYSLGTIRREMAVAGITGTDLQKLPIPIPPLSEQCRIAHILGTLDDKIELNRRMNRTLEAIARAIFKSWFIDFDPVIDNAILNGKPIPDEFAERAEVRREVLARSQPSPPAPLPEVEGRNYRGGFEFSGLVDKARELRQKQTPAEGILWELLRDRRFLDLKFRRQHQIGDYIADFCGHDHKLVIELDGGIHQTQEAKDAKRDAYMESLGLTVLRIPNADVLNSIEEVLSRISEAAGLSPSPLGRGARGEGVASGLPSTFGRGDGGEGVASYRDLFPDSFQESPLGKIPKGWEVAGIGEVCEVVNGGTPSTKNPEYWEPAEIAWATPTDITSLESPIISATARRISKAGLDHSSAKLLPAGAVLVTSRATIGFSAISVVPIATNQGFKSLVCGERLGSLFVLHAIRRLKPHMENLASGSTYPEINARTFRQIAIVIPPESLVSRFEAVAGDLFKQVWRNDANTESLRLMRDTLLPRLLSGELAATTGEQT